MLWIIKAHCGRELIALFLMTIAVSMWSICISCCSVKHTKSTHLEHQTKGIYGGLKGKQQHREMVATAATIMPIAPIRRSLHARTMTAASPRRILPARVGVVIQKRVTPGFPRDGNASFYLHSGQPEPWRANLVTYLFREQKNGKKQ